MEPTSGSFKRLISQADTVARKYSDELQHARQVAFLSLRLFDELKELHHFGPSERMLLEVAALLHDIGWCQGQKKHHKVAQEMIMAEKDLSLSEDERVIVGCLARYHRKALPKDSHPFYGSLLEDKKKMVRRLASFLRLADGLDRSHFSSVKDLHCQISDQFVTVICAPQPMNSIDQEIGMEKADLFEQVFERKLRFGMIFALGKGNRTEDDRIVS